MKQYTQDFLLNSMRLVTYVRTYEYICTKSTRVLYRIVHTFTLEIMGQLEMWVKPRVYSFTAVTRLIRVNAVHVHVHTYEHMSDSNSPQ